MRLIFAFGSLMASLVLAAPGPVAEINRRINCRDICLQQYNDCRNIALLDDQTCVDNVYQADNWCGEQCPPGNYMDPCLLAGGKVPCGQEAPNDGH